MWRRAKLGEILWKLNHSLLGVTRRISVFSSWMLHIQSLWWPDGWSSEANSVTRRGRMRWQLYWTALDQVFIGGLVIGVIISTKPSSFYRSAQPLSKQTVQIILVVLMFVFLWFNYTFSNFTNEWDFNVIQYVNHNLNIRLIIVDLSRTLCP